MTETEAQNTENSTDVFEYDSNEVIRQFKQEIGSGKNWYVALLEAAGRWTITVEVIGDRTFRYLIAGEAFDWMLLAERLCLAAGSLIPEVEKQKFLFYGKTPVNITTEEFQTFLGETRYRQYLNFFYGVTVEEALYLSVLGEVRKDRMNTVFHHQSNFDGEVYQRIYGESQAALLNEFRRGKGYGQGSTISLAEQKEFYYWLFKYRVEHCDRSRVASDTKKAMDFLKEQYVKNLSKAEG